MSGTGKGHVELIVGVIGMALAALLLVIGIIVATSRSSRSGGWFVGAVVSAFTTVIVLSYL